MSHQARRLVPRSCWLWLVAVVLVTEGWQWVLRPRLDDTVTPA